MNPVLPLLALRAFVETGRHRSVKRAAEAMGVTPGAVSQQIRLLEERVGIPLFTRTRYGVDLTAAGAEAHPALLAAFDQISRSMERLEAARARPTLTISTVPSFAASWLVPRLGRFTAKHPDVEVRVEASSALVDLRRDRVDIAIRHGLGHYPGLRIERLMAPVFLPVASPALLAAGPKIHAPADCLNWPLLQDSDRADWRLWFSALGVPVDPRADRGPSFDDDLLLIRSAIAGQGLALVRDTYAMEEIEAGRLALALNITWPTDFAYYAVALPDVSQFEPIDAFLEWLKAEASTEPAALGEMRTIRSV
ncbi:transcriptional regulator GcvA [Rhizobium sp. LCM 4573]|uniref:transcriptional regulator GcvA n=1 Tax=Rhizobium sp. LCM 4573 TaxID=1848291 RepID=UPI0008D9D9F4|nr:transcriptional regulator GcvA [Rhizobium sp. LCM 4573]OHV77077.1 transcriptional regulator [Rhizobium sp. LCM 4573]